MVLTPGTKRLMMGGWVLAALLILVYNAQQAATVLEMPLPSHSREAKTAMRRTQQLEIQSKEKMAEAESKKFNVAKIVARLDRGLQKIKQKISPPKELNKIKKPAPVRKAVKVVEKEEVIILPSLTGIIQIFDTDGKLKLLAAMDGEVYQENAKVQDFRIKQITAKGVILVRGNRTWQIKAPQVDFSVSQ